MKFYNTFLEEKKNKDGDYVTVKKYYYNIDNLLVKIETEHVHSGEKEKEVFHNKNLQLQNSELWMHGKMFSKTQYFYDKNNRLIKEIEKDAKNKVTRIVEYKNYKNDDFFTKLIKDFQNGEVVGKQVMILLNLAPRKIRGIESQGMLLLTTKPDGKLSFVTPDETVENGIEIG